MSSIDVVQDILDREGRYMTEDEIENIVRDIGKFPSSSVTVSEFMREQHQNMLRAYLREQKIIPAILPALKRNILHRMEYSYISPGEPVGPIAAGAVSAPATQMNLSAYHLIGIGGGDSLKSLVEIFGLRTDRSPETMLIHFKDEDLTESEAAEMMFRLEGVTLRDLLLLNQGEQYIEYSSLEELYSFAPHIPNFQNILSYDLNLPEQGTFHRLRFNVTQLFIYKITLPMLVNLLEQNEGVTAIPSSSLKGIIDIFIDPKMVNSSVQSLAPSSISDAISLYYNLEVSKSFNSMATRGRIHKLKNVYIKENSLLKEMDMRERNNGDGTATLFLSSISTQVTGISDAKIRKLFSVLNVEVVEGQYTSGAIWYRVNIPVNETSTIKYIKSRVGAADEAFQEYRKETARKKEYRIDMDFPGGEIYRAANYCYGIANTDTFKQLLAHPVIDETKTILKNPYKVWLVMGIEAAQNVIFKEIFDIINGSGNSIDIRHASLISNHMCWSGHIIPTTGRGASKLGRETIADATFEKPLDIIAEAAFSGIKESTKSTSTCVFFGKQCALGTGSVMIKDDPDIPIQKFSADDNLAYKPTIDLNFDLSNATTETTQFEFNDADDIDFDQFGEKLGSFRPSRRDDDGPVRAPDASGSARFENELNAIFGESNGEFDDFMAEYGDIDFDNFYSYD